MASTATFEQIRAGLVANLDPLEIQSTGYMLGSPTPPSIEILPGDVSYDLVGSRGLDELTMVVRLTVAIGLDIAAQKLLDQYLAPSGTNSVKTLIEANPTLGGTVQDLRVSAASGYQVAQTKELAKVLSCDWTVLIYA
jgi:hypothetical protein